MLEAPEIRYARCGGLNLAYQVIGEGPLDILEVPGLLNHIEVIWENPGLVRYVERLARIGRVILMDRRGTGLSDRIRGDARPTLAERAGDIDAVLDAAGSHRAVLIGIADGGPVAIEFAAQHAERVQALILYATGPSCVQRPDYPYGLPPAVVEEVLARVEREWGTGTMAAPFGDDSPAAREFFARVERRACTPRAAVALMRTNFGEDVRHRLGDVHVPTLVVQRRGHPAWPFEGGEYLAQHIAGARLREDRAPFAALVEFRERRVLADAVEEFLTGAAAMPNAERVLAAILFTDIVDSTGRAAAAGDAAWRGLLDAHDRAVRDAVADAGGQIVDHAGDGVLARFDGVERAVRCAQGILSATRRLGLTLRAGIHAGDCEVHGDRLAGLAVHIGARVAALAGPGEVLVSEVVPRLAAGCDLAFDDRGVHTLRGVPGEWRLFAVR
ncbi:MAG: adenylate/guanylate cyclase domain-containing protein [Deltaproteobacteria bacterium]|nr:adenylate/guanylate cyclase domain-containing protein [Deltaproteobacteria bacterium]